MKLSAKKSIVLGVLVGAAVAISLSTERAAEKSQAPAAVVAKPEISLLRIEQPREAASSVPNSKSVVTANGSADSLSMEEKIKDIDVQIDVLSREVRAAERSVDSGHIKEQLNLESLPTATRELYFAQLKDLARLRRQVIELRFKKFEILHSAIERQASGETKAKS